MVIDHRTVICGDAMPINAEFQAVVLAGGRGSRMLELTASQPKSLLPVGPHPLLYYPVRKLQDAGFTEALVVVQQQQLEAIEGTMRRQPLSIRLDYVALPESGEDLGTADALRVPELQERLKGDVLVMSGDLVSDVELDGVMRAFRKHDAAVATLMLPIEGGALRTPGPKSKPKIERDLVGVDEETGRLVLLASASDFANEVGFSWRMLRKHPKLSLHGAETDAHVYLLKRWVLDFLQSEPSFVSLKGDFIPYIVKKQLARPQNPPQGIWSFLPQQQLQLQGLSSFNSPAGDPIRCYVHLAPKKGLRVNTLSAYWRANAQELEAASAEERLSPLSNSLSTQLDDKSVVWEGAQLDAKTAFKASTIGPHSRVMSYSRVFNSILMSDVEVQERVALEDCVVCDGAVIESEARLINCVVGSGFRVAKGAQHTNELLTESVMDF